MTMPPVGPTAEGTCRSEPRERTDLRHTAEDSTPGVDGPYATGAAESRTEARPALGELVVLDASWSDHRWRDAAIAVAERAHADLVALRCVAPPAGHGRPPPAVVPVYPHADPSIASAMRADADPWPQASEVDTTTAVDETVHHAAAQIRPNR